MRWLHRPAILTTSTNTCAASLDRRSRGTIGDFNHTVYPWATREGAYEITCRQSIPHLQHTLHDIGKCDRVCVIALAVRFHQTFLRSFVLIENLTSGSRSEAVIPVEGYRPGPT